MLIPGTLYRIINDPYNAGVIEIWHAIRDWQEFKKNELLVNGEQFMLVSTETNAQNLVQIFCKHGLMFMNRIDLQFCAATAHD